MSWHSAAGAIRSTADDLCRWHHALLSGRVLRPSSLEAMLTPVRIDARPISTDVSEWGPDGPDDRKQYGLGIYSGIHEGRRQITHTGSTEGADPAGPGERIVEIMSWGIITTIKGKSGKPIQKPVTNVRNLTSPFWRSTIANPEQRCLVPFTSFAEPRPGKDPETGRPANWWFNVPGEEVCAFAGIWRWSEGRKRFAFLTCEPNPLVAPLHPKAMPVILQPEDYDRWLDGEAADTCALAQPFPSQLMAVA